jgi:hypothetical protein
MHYRTLACGFVLGVSAALCTSQALSQDAKIREKPPTKQPSSDKTPAQLSGGMTPEQMQEGMKAWMKAMTPGEPHKLLQKSEGTWDTVMRMWEMGPDAPPTEIKGTTEFKPVLGGRFIMQQLHSNMSMPDDKGQMHDLPWEGMGLFGYDNYRKIYVGCWADTMGTQLLAMKGSLSQDGKVLTMYGEMDEPMMGVIGRYNRYVTTYIDDNTQKFEIYDLHAGDNYKAVEVMYTRRK